MNFIKNNRRFSNPIVRQQDYIVNPAFNIEFGDYKEVLKKMGVKCKTDGSYLVKGEQKLDCQWIVHISVIPNDMKQLLHSIVEILFSNTSFRMIKDQLLHYSVNGGNMGLNSVGKVISFYPTSISQAVDLVDGLREVTKKFNGPIIQNAIRISKNIYVEKFVLRDVVSGGRLPFVIEKEYRLRKKPWWLVKRGYCPVSQLKASERGLVFKGVLVWKMDWCLIKYGFPFAVADHLGRNVNDMLEWQYKVLDELWKRGVQVPKVLGYFEDKYGTCLITEYVEGVMLREVMKDLLNNRYWHVLERQEKQLIIKYCLQIIDIVDKIHAAGFVHRDLTCYNLIIDRKGNMKVVDLELSYSVRNKKPSPQFIGGTDGFVAPEQLLNCFPNYPEDIYTIGALLWFMFTGKLPDGNREMLLREIRTSSKQLIGDIVIIEMIKSCIDSVPSRRPGIEVIGAVIRNIKIQ